MFHRVLEFKLPPSRSAFLWGARQTGKSTYLKTIYAKSIHFDLLQTDIVHRFEMQPSLLRQEILAQSKSLLEQPIIIDEIQKVPALLDEIHWLIENHDCQFILCGSSARKLKKVGTNLLGGRAVRYHFYPLVSIEIPNFDLLNALQKGLIPSHYLSEHIDLLLESYVLDYLNEEIREEGLVRNLPCFSRFLDSIGFSNGQLTNYNNIARDCGVSAKTVISYYQILVDTLLGYFVPPFNKKIKRDLISKTPKFYLFDVGVANYLAKRRILDLKGAAAGEAFEHFILMELMAFQGLQKKRLNINYWRTKTGLEVDFILEDGNIAIEVKISSHVRKTELKGLLAFCEENSPKQAIVVSCEPRARLLTVGETNILILPHKEFLKRLWEGEIIE